MERMKVLAHALVMAAMLGLPSAGIAQPLGRDDVDRLTVELAQYEYEADPAILRNMEQALRQAPPEVRSHLVDRLVALVRSEEATLAGKRFACTQLWSVGTEETSREIAGLLADPETCEMVCYALAGQESPRVDQLLREVLPATTGPARMQIIGLLGQRADADSTPVLIQEAQSENESVVAAAVAALGRTGTLEAARFLRNARLKADGEARADLSQAYIACAQALARRGHAETARQIYQELANDRRHPLDQRAGVLGWLGLCEGRVDDPLLDYMAQGPPQVRAVMIAAAGQLAGEGVTTQLLDRLNATPPQDEVLLIEALAERDDPRIRPAITGLADSPKAGVRQAALLALAKVGNDQSIAVLADALDGSESDRQAAMTALRRICCDGFESALIEALKRADGSARIALLGLVGERQVTAAAEVILPLALDGDTETRKAALRALATLGGPEHGPALLQGFLAHYDAALADEAARTLAALATQDLQVKRDRHVFQAWNTATDSEHRVFLLRVLARLGGSDAMAVVHSACDDADPAVRDAAIRDLSQWSDPAALPVLAALVGRTDGAHRVLALRGYTRLVRSSPPDSCAETARTLASFRPYAPQAAEQQLLLSALGTLDCAEALDIAAGFLDNTAVVQEAALATVQIAERIKDPTPQQAAGIRSVLQEVRAAAVNAELMTRAEQVLQRLGPSPATTP